jgi:hypothetical protein
MTLFSRSPSDLSPRYLTLTPEDLRRFGITAFGGEDIYPPGISGIPRAELDAPALAFHAAAGESPPAPAAYREFFTELHDAADLGGDWAYVGAFCVGLNTMANLREEEPAYLQILDRALEVRRTDGVTYTSVPSFAIKRWGAIHGYEEIDPVGWPNPLTYLQVPSPVEAPPVDDLAPGELRKLAQAPAAPANMVCAESRADGTIQAVIEGTDPDSGQLRHWDWEGLSAPDYPAFLRELGDRLVTHTYWAHDDVLPYFPCRTRSRDQLRIEAREWRP